MKQQNEKEKNKKKSKGVEKSKRRQYSEENVKKALEAIKNGMAKKQAARKYQVPGSLRETKLDDILVFPKTPQRKGVRQTKKTPYVITSKEFKDEEREKIKAKKEKEEGIQKRKEQRQQKKLAKTEQMLKKEEKIVKRQVDKKHDSAESAKRIIFSKDFYKLNNIVVDLKNKQEKKKDDIKEEFTQGEDKNIVEFTEEKDESKLELKQEQINNENRVINKENNTENCNRQSLSFNNTKIKNEKCDNKNKITKKPNKTKKDDTKNKNIVKNILYSEEALCDTDEDEIINDGGRTKAKTKFSIAEIEKMLAED